MRPMKGVTGLGPEYTTGFESSWGDYREKLLTVQTGAWRSVRPVVSRDGCRLCGWCYMACPAGCIKKYKDGYYHADLDFCKGCGLCAFECPAQTIRMITEQAVSEDCD